MKTLSHLRHRYRRILLSLASRAKRATTILQRVLDSLWATFVASVLAGFLLYSGYSIPNWLALTPESARTLLTIFAGGGLTILAIFYAVLNVRIQMLSQRLPGELVHDIINRAPAYRAVYWRLLITVFASVLSLASLSSNVLNTSSINVVTLAILLLGLTLTRLLNLARAGLTSRYPEAIVRAVLNRIDDSYFIQVDQRRGIVDHSSATGVLTMTTDQFAMVEQVAAKAIREGDLTTANLLMRSVTEAVLEFVEHNKSNARGVLGWLGQLFSVIGRNSLRTEPRVTEIIIDLVSRVSEQSFTKRLGWDQQIEFNEAISEIWSSAIEQRATSMLTRMIRESSGIFRVVTEFAPPEDQLASLFEGEEQKPVHNSDAEIEWQQSYVQFVSSLNYRCASLVDNGIVNSFGAAQFAYRMMAWHVVQSTHMGARQKKRLLRSIILGSSHSIQRALRKNPDSGYVIWSLDPSIHTEYASRGLEELITLSINAVSEVAIESAGAGCLPWVLLNEIAAAGRGYAAKGDDTLGAMIAETLGALGPLLRVHKDQDMKERYLEAAKGLHSIDEWDKRTKSDLKEVVKQQLLQFPDEAERLKQWQAQVPSRKALKTERPHDFPWA